MSDRGSPAAGPPGPGDGVPAAREGAAAAGGEHAVRRALCRAGRELHELGLAAGTAGNLSARLSDGRVLVTPSGARKDRLDPGDLLALDPEDPDPDAVAAGSVELPLHLACYGADAAVGAVVHAHAPALTAAGLRGLDVAGSLPELEAATGVLATVPFRPSGSDELAAAAADAVAAGGRVLLLQRHGAVAVGAHAGEALLRLELAELSAHAVLLSLSAGLELDLGPVLRLHGHLLSR